MIFFSSLYVLLRIFGLYSVTTISGPPLAVALSNQGLAQQEFRAALGFIRLAESTMTAIAYGVAGLYTAQSASLIPVIIPSLAIGVPVGGYLIRRMQADLFRRVCMSFDAWIVGFGLSGVLRDLHVLSGATPYAVFVAVVAFDIWLYRFFTSQRAASSAPAYSGASGSTR